MQFMRQNGFHYIYSEQEEVQKVSCQLQQTHLVKPEKFFTGFQGQVSRFTKQLAMKLLESVMQALKYTYM